MSCALANRVPSRRSQTTAGCGYYPPPACAGYSGRGLALTLTAASGQLEPPAASNRIGSSVPNAAVGPRRRRADPG